MSEAEVKYSRPIGWTPTPKPTHHHILAKAGLKVVSNWPLTGPWELNHENGMDREELEPK